MAGVLLSDDLFGSNRLLRFAALMAWSNYEALGRLACAWRETQDRGLITVDRGALMDAFIIFDEATGDRLIKALIGAPFVKVNEDGLYTVIGNAKHIDKIQKRREAGQRGGEKRVSNCQANAKQMLDACQANAKQTEANAKQIQATLNPSPFPDPDPNREENTNTNPPIPPHEGGTSPGEPAPLPEAKARKRAAPRPKKPKQLTKPEATALATKVIGLAQRVFGVPDFADPALQAFALESIGPLAWRLVRDHMGLESLCNQLTRRANGQLFWDASRVTFVVAQIRDALIGLSVEADPTLPLPTEASAS